MRHFDVQMIGGMVLNAGKIGEMRTGEGKTLVATLPVYLNALTGKGVHVVTVNDYLAKRDAEWMGKLYNFLGLTVGINLSQMPNELKRQAYAADITYGTNNEYGFDYLRDNMVHEREARVQRGLSYALIDEVDSILIDEARTPLIISGQADNSIALYNQINEVAAKLIAQTEEEGEGDFWVDEKGQNVVLSEQGHERAEVILTAVSYTHLDVYKRQIVPINKPPNATGPNNKPTAIGTATGNNDGIIISLMAAVVSISTALPYSGLAVPSIMPLMSRN